MSEFRFLTMFSEQLNGQNFTKFYILTRSRLELLSIIFCLFVTHPVMALIDFRISFPLNIFRKNGQNLTNLSTCALIFTRSRLGLLPVIFLKFITELWPLIDIRISFSLYFETKWIEFHLVLNMLKVRIVTCHFSQICTTVMPLD